MFGEQTFAQLRTGLRQKILDLRSCVKVEVAVLGSLINLRFLWT